MVETIDFLISFAVNPLKRFLLSLVWGLLVYLSTLTLLSVLSFLLKTLANRVSAPYYIRLSSRLAGGYSGLALYFILLCLSIWWHSPIDPPLELVK